MDEPRDYQLNEASQRKKYDITYMWNLKYDTYSYLWNRNRLRDVKSKLMGAKRDVGGWEGRDESSLR